ncbi:hypothetical protein PATSB16_11590 [Pandoraea thiooxydans]|uniref:Prepilin type IV endopeptidase peptidase domain-containing protein n=2 Tax=Pandoraea thiooxydans TaxID=445709 RepID=A0A0G3ES22_9BURK|nr:hypothetical protein ABW99_03645 [Pandoraea thiooxydans]APR94501.1 hypothetical protein PATSB16_11590 [Pandoraea thiooxydans]
MLLLAILCIPALCTDLLARRVPNTLLAAIMLLQAGWLAWQLIQGGSWHSASVHLLGLGLGLLALLPFWVIGWMGAGDVKLFAVIGFLLGYRMLLPVWALASLLNGAALVALWFARSRPALALVEAKLAGRPCGERLRQMRAGRHGMPYAAFLALSALVIASI